jgi:hypothetical protein
MLVLALALLVTRPAIAAPTGPALPDCNALDMRCQVLKTKIIHLRERDPVAEAASAAKRGDFRLGAHNFIGPGARGWDTPGVECGVWTRDLISKWHVNQDVVMPGDSEHSAAAMAFLAAYNKAVVSDPAFPYRDICAVEGHKPEAVYSGPVHTFAQAARSGDVSKVEAVATQGGQDVNARDPFGFVALNWAMVRENEPVARALLALGADPNLRSGGSGQQGAAPLARALDQRRFDLANLMLAHGARMEGDTDLCRYQIGPVFLGDIKPTKHCSWAGLLIEAGRFDMLDAQARAGHLDRLPHASGAPDIMVAMFTPAKPMIAIDDRGELDNAFQAALAGHDDALARRLAPYANRRIPDDLVRKLLEKGRTDLAAAAILAEPDKFGRSPTEGLIWASAAKARHDEALAFLVDFGAELNLLTLGRLEQCRGAAAVGDVDALFACSKEAAERRLAIEARIAGHDDAGFAAAVHEAADLRERDKAALTYDVAKSGSPAMLQALLARGASPNRQFQSVVLDGRTMKPIPVASSYAGRRASQAQAWAQASGYANRLLLGGDPLTEAVKRSDTVMIQMLADAGVENLVGQAQSVGGMARGPHFSWMMPGQVDDAEKYPNGPDKTAMRSLDVLATAIVKRDGPQALEPVFREAVSEGWNDVLTLLLAKGFKGSEAQGPDFIWQAWSGLQYACKPSTGEILVRAGVRVDYPLIPSRNGWRPEKMVAASCRDPASAGVLIKAGLAGVNDLDENGRTVLDTAIQYRHPQMADAIRALGGKTAADLNPTAFQNRKAKLRKDDDLDLVQSEDQ